MNGIELITDLCQHTVSISPFAYLEVNNGRLKLLAFQQVWYGGVEATLCQTDHLGTDTDTALIQEASSIFVSMTNFAEHVFSWHAHTVKVQHTCAGCANAQFVLLFANCKAGRITVHNECRDALVALFCKFHIVMNSDIRHENSLHENCDAKPTFDGSTLAITKNTFDTSELDIHIFVPLST